MKREVLRIGIDFDNTIVDYRPIFASAARELALLDAIEPDATKSAIRAMLRARPAGELDWQRLQAHVYGIAIEQAPAFAGFEAFLREARGRGNVYVVSHKTRFAAAAPQGPDLREAARRWLDARGITVDGVFFEEDREAKLACIARLELTHFVDDLEDVLHDPAFPAATRAIHFRDSWEAVYRDVFG